MYVTKEKSIYMRYLNQDKRLSCNQIMIRFLQFSKTTVCQHMKRRINHNVFDKRIKNSGRPKKLTKRDEKYIIRAVHRLRISIGSFTAKRLRTEAGIPAIISVWTIRRVLNRHGYRYLQSRKKGILTSKDAYIRLKFARRMKRLSPYSWKRYISFYFDETSFVHESYEVTRMEKTKRRLSPALYKRQQSRSSGESCPFFLAIVYKKGVVSRVGHVPLSLELQCNVQIFYRS